MFGEPLGRSHPDIKNMIALSDRYSELITLGRGIEYEYFPWLTNFNTPTTKLVKTYFKDRDELFDRYLNKASIFTKIKI